MRRQILAIALIVVVALFSTTTFAQVKKFDKSEKAKDPVCGLMVDKNHELSTNHKGETYYFCSKADLEQFKKAPEKYPNKK
jgi:YHS domain-containing protein